MQLPFKSGWSSLLEVADVIVCCLNIIDGSPWSSDGYAYRIARFSRRTREFYKSGIKGIWYAHLINWITKAKQVNLEFSPILTAAIEVSSIPCLITLQEHYKYVPKTIFNQFLPEVIFTRGFT